MKTRSIIPEGPRKPCCETESTSSESKSHLKSRRKRKSNEQVKILERESCNNHNLDKSEMARLAKKLHLTTEQVYK